MRRWILGLLGGLVVVACMGTGCKKEGTEEGEREEEKKVFNIKLKKSTYRMRSRGGGANVSVEIDLFPPGMWAFLVQNRDEKMRWYTLRYNISDPQGIVLSEVTCRVPRSPSQLVPAVIPYYYVGFMPNHSYEISEGRISMSFTSSGSLGSATVSIHIEDEDGNAKEERVVLIAQP